MKVDPFTETIIIEGIRYSFEFFRGFGLRLYTGETFRIIERANGTVTVERCEPRKKLAPPRIAGETVATAISRL